MAYEEIVGQLKAERAKLDAAIRALEGNDDPETVGVVRKQRGSRSEHTEAPEGGKRAEKRAAIEKALRNGKKPPEIVEELRCALATVYDVKKKLE